MAYFHMDVLHKYICRDAWQSFKNKMTFQPTKHYKSYLLSSVGLMLLGTPAFMDLKNLHCTIQRWEEKETLYFFSIEKGREREREKKMEKKEVKRETEYKNEAKSSDKNLNSK